MSDGSMLGLLMIWKGHFDYDVGDIRFSFIQALKIGTEFRFSLAL